jgi:hypothetical protein
MIFKIENELVMIKTIDIYSSSLKIIIETPTIEHLSLFFLLKGGKYI